MENNCVFLRIFFQVVGIYEKNPSKFEHGVYYHTYGNILAGFRSMCTYVGILSKLIKIGL